MSQTRTEQKLLEIEGFMETEKIYIPPFGAYLKRKSIQTELAELKEFLNEDLEELNNIKAMKEEILEEAKADAERIRKKAREDVENQDVSRQAREYAKEIMQKAQKKAQNMLDEAQDLRNQLVVNSHKYVDTLFDDLEKQLIDQKETVTSNRDQLRLSLEKKMEVMHKLKSPVN